MSEQNFCLIDFAYENADEVFVHGTLRQLMERRRPCGRLRGKRARRRTIEVDVAEFDALWDVLNEPVFQRHAVRSPDALLDFRSNYVVGIVFNVEGEAGRMTYLVPFGEHDPIWQDWLVAIEATQHSA